MNQLIPFICNPKKASITIFCIAILIYANTIPSKWALDDGLVIHENQLVRKGISGIPAIMTHDFMYGNLGENTNAVAGGRYRPLTVAMYACFAEVFGKPQIDSTTGQIQKDKDGNLLKDLSEKTIFPNLMHLLNILLYATLSLVLYRFLCLVFAEVKNGLLIAFIATFIFTVHPIHTEVVANVKGSDEILALLFSLLAATYFFKYFTQKERKKTLQLILGLLFLFLGLLAKENAVMFIVLIPLTLWFFTKTKFNQVLISGGLLLLPFAGYMALRTNAIGQTNLNTETQTEMMNNPFLVVDKDAKFSPLTPGSSIMVLQGPDNQNIREMPFQNKLATNIYTFGKYLKLLVLPHPLTYDYYPRQIAVKSFADIGVLFSLLLNVGLLVFAILEIKKKRVYSYGILFYFITFALVSNLFFPIGTNMAERFMFMPSVGACIVLACLAVYLMDKIGKTTTTGVLVIVAISYSIITYQRNLNWKDNFTLFSHDLNVSTNSAKVKSDYGESVLLKVNQLVLQAREEQREQTGEEQQEKINLLQSTLPYYKEALDINPVYGVAWQNLARTMQILGEQESIDANVRLNYLETALAAYRPANRYLPASSATGLNQIKSLCYSELGKLYGQNLHNLDSAFKYLHLAEKTDPKNSYANLLLGTAYAIKGDIKTGYDYTQKAYKQDSLNRYYQENYALITQKMVQANYLAKKELLKAEKLLLAVVDKNNNLPVDDPQKQAFSKRTLSFLYENYQLQGKTKAAEEISHLLQTLN